jgi:hypothetical protein
MFLPQGHPTDSLRDKWAGIRSSFSKKVGWNAGLDPIVAVDANVAGRAFVAGVVRVWTWVSCQLYRGENCSWL